MPRENPTIGKNSPVIVRAFHNALEESMSAVDDMKTRQAQHGKRWLINGRQTVTPTQTALYIYIENPTTDKPLNVEGLDLYTDQAVTIDLYDEPTLDEATFSAEEFKNVRSSVRKDPPYNFYKGTENNVTISDKGRSFISTFAKPSRKKSIGASHGAPGYIIDPESSALIEIALDSNNDTTISANLYCHEEVSVPDLTQLDGTN